MFKNGDRVKLIGETDTRKSTNLWKGVLPAETQGIVVYVTIYPAVAGVRFDGVSEVINIGTKFIEKVDTIGPPDTYLDVLKHREAMLQSYVDAIEVVGGNSQKFLRELDRMTVQEMVDVLAQNGVRFTTNR